MGSGSRRRRAKSTNKVSGETRGASSQTVSYTPIEQDNELFTKYYKTLGIVPETEWDDFMACLRSPLPVTFRLTRMGSAHLLKSLLDRLQKEHFPYLSCLVAGESDPTSGIREGQPIPPPEPLPWYPNNLAWMVHAGRSEVRRHERYTRLHSLLVRETEAGTICRQEAVSMVPPLFLDIGSDDVVLDMCAAPGSKTCQLIEQMHFSNPNRGTLPSGVVVANDVDSDRAYMMVHQVKRMNSPCLVVTNNDASAYPHPRDKETGKLLYFDKILCDVPCSGDGTMRKNKLIWRTWSPRQGSSLHSLQLSILERASALLRVGGRIVYSTCSLNPLENEAVVAAAVARSRGSLRLVDVSSELEALFRRPGMKSWQVIANVESLVGENSSSSPPDTMFPPEDDLNLDLCMRFLPHVQNTGGFFVAVLEKTLEPNSIGPCGADNVATGSGTSEHSVSSKEERNKAFAKQDLLSRVPGVQRKKESSRFPSDTFLFQDGSSPYVSAVVRRWKLDGSFPCDQMLARSAGEHHPCPQLFLLSRKAKEFIKKARNTHSVVYAGLSAFSKCDTKEASSDTRGSNNGVACSGEDLEKPCIDELDANLGSGHPSTIEAKYLGDEKDADGHRPSPHALISYRIKYQALQHLLPFVDEKSILDLDSPSDILQLLQEELVKFESLSGRLNKTLDTLPIGCHIARFASAGEASHSHCVPVWRGRSSVHALVCKTDKASLLSHWRWIFSGHCAISTVPQDITEPSNSRDSFSARA